MSGKARDIIHTCLKPKMKNAEFAEERHSLHPQALSSGQILHTDIVVKSGADLHIHAPPLWAPVVTHSVERIAQGLAPAALYTRKL